MDEIKRFVKKELFLSDLKPAHRLIVWWWSFSLCFVCATAESIGWCLFFAANFGLASWCLEKYVPTPEEDDEDADDYWQ